MPHSRTFCLLFALFGAGCSGQSGSENPVPGPSDAGTDAFVSSGCEVQSSESLGIDETSPLGFSGRDMLDLAEGVHRATLRYENGESTGLRSVISYANGNVVFVDRRRSAQGAGPSSACPDSLEVTVEARLETDDGRFLERYDAVLTAVQRSENGYFIELDPDSLQGSFDYADFDGQSYDRRRLFIDALFDEAGTNGRISGVGENDGNAEDPDDNDQSTFTPIGNWQ